MRLRIFAVPGRLSEFNEISETCFVKISKDQGEITREGIIPLELLPHGIIATALGPEDTHTAEAYFSVDNLQVGYYLGAKEERRQSIPDILSALQTGIFEKERIDQKISLPYLLMFINDVSRPLMGICSLKGRVNEQDLVQAAKNITFACLKGVSPILVSLDNHELIQFVSEYLEDGYNVIQAGTNLSEGKIYLTHPEDIFSDRDVQEINDRLLLRDKIEKGDWLYLKIVGETYAIAISKTSRDVFTFQIVEENINKAMPATVVDIFSRVFKTKKGRISYQKTLDF